MPSPSRTALFSGLLVTTAIFFGGAWLASGMTPGDAAPTDIAPDVKQLPLLAPIPALPDASMPINQNPDTPASPETASIPLQVTIQGARNDKGKVIILVFDDAAAFSAYDYQRAVGYAELAASTAPISHAFGDLDTGPYAIAIIHDENLNYDLDMAAGYPVEGYGTSRADTPYDELSFQQAAIAPGPVTVKLHYLQ